MFQTSRSRSRRPPTLSPSGSFVGSYRPPWWISTAARCSRGDVRDEAEDHADASLELASGVDVGYRSSRSPSQRMKEVAVVGEPTPGRFDPVPALRSMTLAEKARMCTGRDFWTLYGLPRLGVPGIRLADGPHGLRKPLGSTADPTVRRSAPATCFPTASAMA